MNDDPNDAAGMDRRTGEDRRLGDPKGEDRQKGRLDRKLLELLVCPLTKTTLRYDADAQELVSVAAKLAYPIRDGIPIMLPEEARSLD